MTNDLQSGYKNLIFASLPFFCYLVALWLHVPANSLSQEENEGKYEVKIGHAATLCQAYAAQAVWRNVVCFFCLFVFCCFSWNYGKMLS